ncbi:hypothetical protein EVAR_63898_1 [Eumeta japonica]|uniref:Immunoglobulin domain-containing protein n=1 Tax=Eumeta variegata TaxID=151549 RepID=A0A4C1ZK52_EUMVA|nr:hypothetical protein EVAR_63898_1 [Eumeta japonica]
MRQYQTAHRSADPAIRYLHAPSTPRPIQSRRDAPAPERPDVRRRSGIVEVSHGPIRVAVCPPGCCQVTEVVVELSAPRWVSRGGSATLRCVHAVPASLLYKVEFLRTGSKLLQYVRERNPPFTSYSFTGGVINMSLSTESSITIDNLETTATGLYWCEVSLETPIFTAASPMHQITVVYPQKHPPIITFGEPDVVVGGLLRANCTSAPAAPAPSLMWYIDDLQVGEESLRRYSYRVSSSTRSKGGGVRHRKQHRYLAPELNHTSRYREYRKREYHTPSEHYQERKMHFDGAQQRHV